MRFQPDAAPKEAATLRRYLLPTELGPCTVRVQEGAEGAPRVRHGGCLPSRRRGILDQLPPVAFG